MENTLKRSLPSFLKRNAIRYHPSAAAPLPPIELPKLRFLNGGWRELSIDPSCHRVYVISLGFFCKYNYWTAYLGIEPEPLFCGASMLTMTPK